MATELDAFLKAEESASELLTSLEQLKDEIEGYSRAKGTLEDVRSQLVSLIQTLGRTAEQSTSVMTALEKIGTPEILKEIEKVVVTNDRTVTALEEMRKDVGEAIPSMESTIGKAIAENTESHTFANVATRKQIGVMKQQLDSISKSLGNDMAQIRGRVEQQGKSIKLMIGIGLPLVAVAIAVLLFVIKNN